MSDRDDSPPNVPCELTLKATLDGVIRTSGPGYARTLGWSASDLEGRRFFDIIHPDDLPATAEIVQRLEKGGPPLIFRNRCRHKDGSYRTIVWAASTDNHHLHTAGHDITSEIDAVAALNAAREALHQTQKIQAVGRLHAGIGHEVNNLMQSILASLELTRRLIATGRTEETEKFVAKAIASAQRAAALNQRLAGISSPHPGEQRPIAMDELVDGMRDMLQSGLGHSHRIEVEPSIGLWNTCCSINQAANAIVNLVLNARDAMPAGGAITIKTGNADLQTQEIAQSTGLALGQYVRISVADSGVGMCQDLIDRARDAFFSTKEAGQHLGLGLTMVQRFAQQSGGAVTLHSQLDRGTTVNLYLPRHATPCQ